jgi:SAM-dependent methyltransferase
MANAAIFTMRRNRSTPHPLALNGVSSRAVNDPLRGFDPKATYDAASSDYEDASRDFWRYMSTRTVELAAPQPGETVLDVACGNGPGLLAASRAVGPSGRVIGIDFATQMLEIAEGRVRAAGADNVEVRTGDMTALDIQPGSVDVLLCVLGVFFVDDMPGLLRSFWSLLRPGGRMAITVLGERFFDPMIDIFIDAVHAERPGFDIVQPWRRIGDAATFRALAEEAGLSDVTLRDDVDTLTLEGPADWWRIVIGSGLRRTAEALGDDTAEKVRARCGEAMQERGVRDVELSSQYLLATHP